METDASLFNTLYFSWARSACKCSKALNARGWQCLIVSLTLVYNYMKPAMLTMYTFQMSSPRDAIQGFLKNNIVPGPELMIIINTLHPHSA